MSKSMVSTRAKVSGYWITDYRLRVAASPKRLVVLLHGYSRAGEEIFKKLSDSIDTHCHLLAPNAPFPIPEKKESGGYRVGFSWYFYDPTQDDYFFDMDSAIKMVTGLIQNLKLEHLPTTLIGFSQGGYLSSVLAQHLPQVDQVITLGAEYLPDEIDQAPRYQADAVHGENDEIVPIEDARASHQKMLNKWQIKGSFVQLPNVGHSITAEMRDAVGQLVFKS